MMKESLFRFVLKTTIPSVQLLLRSAAHRVLYRYVDLGLLGIRNHNLNDDNGSEFTNK